MSYDIDEIQSTETVVVTDLTKQDLAVLMGAFERFNAITSPLQTDYAILEEAVSEFNYSQKYHAVRQCDFQSPSEMVLSYAQKSKTVKASIQRHSVNRKCLPRFEIAYITFNEFFKANLKRNYTIFPGYDEFRRTLSTMCHYVWLNIRDGYNGKKAYDRLSIAPLQYKVGQSSWKIPDYPPCRLYLLPQNNTTVTREKLSTVAGIKRCLQQMLQDYFPEIGIKFFSGDAVRHLMTAISYNYKLEKVEQLFLWLIDKQIKKEFCGITYIWGGSHAPPKRHIAWCMYEHKRRCVLLGMECHTSINCPFYRELSSKKNTQ